jgi:hypothetical protein
MSKKSSLIIDFYAKIFQLASHQRAKKKRDELQAAILAQRKAHK